MNKFAKIAIGVLAVAAVGAVCAAVINKPTVRFYAITEVPEEDINPKEEDTQSTTCEAEETVEGSEVTE